MDIGARYFGVARGVSNNQSLGPRRLSHLWQLPLLMVSMVLFACAAYLFVDARPGITLNQKLATPRELLRADRPDAAAEQLQRLLDAEKFSDPQAAQIHLLLAEAIESAAKQDTKAVAADWLQVIEQTQTALAKGAKPSGDIHRRLGESYEALNKPVEAVGQYRQAIALDPPRAIRLQRKVIDLQIATSDWAPAEASIDAYLAVRELTDAERAWAKSLKAQLLIDRGEYVDARTILEDVLRLSSADPTAQAEARYRLGICAWKLGSIDEAKKLLTAALGAFRSRHPLEADAAYALGQIAQEQNDVATALAQYDAALAVDASGPAGRMARLARGACRVQSGNDVADGVADLLAAAESAKALGPLREPVLKALRKASETLSLKQDHAAAIELLLAEQGLDDHPVGGFFVRLGSAYEERARQVEQSIDTATGGEKLRREEVARELHVKAGDALLAASRALAVSGDRSYGETLWKAMDQYDRGGDAKSAIAAMELFVTERAADPLAPDALLRLGQVYERTGEADKAASAYGRLQGGYAQSEASLKAAVPLAMILAQSPQTLGTAERVLRKVVGDSAAEREAGETYRQALFELACLEQRGGKLKDAAGRFEQFTARFSSDARLGEAMFRLGECCLAQAQETTVQLASASDPKAGASDLAAGAAEKKLQLTRAAELFDRVEAHYSAGVPTREADQRYQKLAALRRADCAYELGAFQDAIRLYDAIASRWPNDPVALAACVQTVNSYFALGRGAEARSAHERARMLLAKLPRGADQGMNEGDLIVPRTYWDQWLKWNAATPAW